MADEPEEAVKDSATVAWEQYKAKDSKEWVAVDEEIEQAFKDGFDAGVSTVFSVM